MQTHQTAFSVLSLALLTASLAICGEVSEFTKALNAGAEAKDGIARILAGAPNLLNVELLPYNRFAGAKYAKLGRVYSPGFDESRAPDLSPLPVGG